ncbi:peptidoglycan-binding protein [Pseudanabaena sp. FACHB-1998]|uniref:peptidoglycan-binding domain-containing protein n=1 Tax=Pseudanabaena sp. FACHB-1998 TaxID=2692858 RepID=UPI001681A06B|nr:peptidoglycan-binding protein [Pseudanabaena sp. FACHB-1998]MBD2178181.1 peptidoglycan-binding protein [Pseudanabaena sp. FACHB-1998]
MDAILKQGSKGNAVAELQQLLQAKGFYSGKIDGDFGTGTANAVLKFQKANGLTADGIVGNASWTLLRGSQSPSAATSLPTLLSGSKGQAVAQAQQLLKAKGYYQGRIDGDFGAGTREAIANFQRANGLTVDGKVGNQTWQKLQAPAIPNATPPQATNPTEIVIEPPTASPTPAPVATPTPSTSAPPISSIFVPTPSPSTPPNPSPPSTATPASPSVTPTPPETSPTTSIPVGAISLISAANSYARAKLPNQTLAINNLQANIPAEILPQFFERWQTASGQVPSSLADAFSSYNAAQMTNQNLALQWLQGNLLPQAIETFRQDWSRLNTSTEFGTPFTPPSSTPASPPINNLQLISLSGAVKVYSRAKFPNQVTALENLQRSLSDVILQQFFQRWALASQQSTLPISLVDIFENYEDYNFPDQLTALQWLEKQLTVTQIEQFSRDWQS